MMNRILLLAFLIFFACTKEEPPILCSNDVDLGVYYSQNLIPYSDFKVLNFENAQGKEDIVTANHPLQFSWVNLRHLEILQESGCGMTNVEDKFNWIIEKRNHILTFALDAQLDEIWVEERAIVSEVDERFDYTGYTINFKVIINSNALNETEPFMTLEKEGSVLSIENEGGFTYHDKYENSGFEFDNVFINNIDLDLDVKNIFYNSEKGLVGFIDKFENVWQLKE